MLSIQDLQKLANWEPLESEFGCNSNIYERRILPILSDIEKYEHAQTLLTNNGGNLSNYVAVFVDTSGKELGNIQGLYIHFSLLTPIAAIGRGAAYIGENSWGYSSIEPNEVLEESDTLSPFEAYVLQAVVNGGFKLLTRLSAQEKLPPSISPYEYCLNNEPWDSFIHVLFSDTD